MSACFYCVFFLYWPPTGIEPSSSINVLLIAVIISLLFIVVIIVAVNVVVCIVWWRKKKQKKSELVHIYDMPNFQLSPTQSTRPEDTKPLAMRTNPSYNQINPNKNISLAATNPGLLAIKEEPPASSEIQESIRLSEMNASEMNAHATHIQL